MTNSLSLVNTLSCKFNYFPHISWFVLLLLLLVFTNQNTTHININKFLNTLVEEQSLYHLTHRCGVKTVHTFYGGITYLPNPYARAGYDTRSIFKRSLTGFNSEFSFSKTSCFTKEEEPNLPYYLPIAGGRIIGFIPFPRVLVLCEMPSVSSRIWTRVTVSISYDDNHYTIGTLFYGGITTKVNVIIRLEFELTFYHVAIPVR